MIKPREKERKTNASKNASGFRSLEKSNYAGDKELLDALDQRRMILVELLKGSSMKVYTPYFFPSSGPSDDIQSIISELQALLEKKLTQKEEALCESEIDRLKVEIKKQCKRGTRIRFTALTHCNHSEANGKTGTTNGTDSQDI